MNKERFLKMLGLAVRAGGVAFGEGAAQDSIRKKSAHLLIVSQDGSDNTKKKFRNSCGFYSVRYTEYGTRSELGKATGREFAVVVAVTNKNIADNLIEILNEEKSETF